VVQLPTEFGFNIVELEAELLGRLLYIMTFQVFFCTFEIKQYSLMNMYILNNLLFFFSSYDMLQYIAYTPDRIQSPTVLQAVSYLSTDLEA